jgi:hypothetical protein
VLFIHIARKKRKKRGLAKFIFNACKIFPFPKNKKDLVMPHIGQGSLKICLKMQRFIFPLKKGGKRNEIKSTHVTRKYSNLKES